MPGSNLPSSEFVQIKAPAEHWFGKIEPPGQGMSTEQCEIISLFPFDVLTFDTSEEQT